MCKNLKFAPLLPVRRNLKTRGVTLIELMIGLAILGVLLALAAPSVGMYAKNSRIRALASSFYAGAQVARAEAIRTNGAVEILLTNAEPTTATVAAATSGVNWVVRTVAGEDANGDPVYRFVQGGVAKEGASNTATVAGTRAAVTFGSLGAADAPMSVLFTYPDFGNCVSAGGPIQCLQVEISKGGQIRMCDPSITAATDNRKCG